MEVCIEDSLDSLDTCPGGGRDTPEESSSEVWRIMGVDEGERVEIVAARLVYGYLGRARLSFLREDLFLFCLAEVCGECFSFKTTDLKLGEPSRRR